MYKFIIWDDAANELELEADYFYIDQCSNLIFVENSMNKMAFAAGVWHSVERIKENNDGSVE